MWYYFEMVVKHLSYFFFIYIGGSKEENKVGCATFTNGNCKTLRLPDDSSIFTAEAKAIDLALDFINECNSKDKGHLCLRLGYSLIDKYVTFKDENA